MNEAIETLVVLNEHDEEVHETEPRQGEDDKVEENDEEFVAALRHGPQRDDEHERTQQSQGGPDDFLGVGGVKVRLVCKEVAQRRIHMCGFPEDREVASFRSRVWGEKSRIEPL